MADLLTTPRIVTTEQDSAAYALVRELVPNPYVANNLLSGIYAALAMTVASAPSERSGA